jgi:RNA-directed DNA polymerase
MGPCRPGSARGEPVRGEPRARPGPEVKPFEIGRRLVCEAREKVRAGKGAPGAGAVSIGVFEQQWRDNLCKLWNGMSSGSYFPGPVRGVEIPKDHGAGVRLPGVPAEAA